MRGFDAIWAWTYNGPVSGNLQSALLGHSLTTYGWVWLVVAIILFAAGLGVIVRSQFARWFGIAAAALAAISAIWWMPYPIGRFTYIIIAMFVIYTLAAYGEREPAR